MCAHTHQKVHVPSGLRTLTFSRMKQLKSYISQIFKVYGKEFRLIFHDPGVILFFAFLPLAYPVIYSLIYNPEVVRNVKTVVVDHDRSASSRELVRKFDATQEARVTGYAADMSEAKRAMHSHDCYAILEIPEGFGKKIGRGEQAQAVLYSDMSLLLRYRGLVMASTNVAMDMGARIREEKINATIPAVSGYLHGDPLPIIGVSMGNTQSGFDSFIMPAVLVLILHQCIVLAVGMMGGAMHETPHMVGYNPWNESSSVICTLIGKTLAYYMILVVPVIFLIHYVPMIFSFPMAGDILEIMAFLLPMSLACIFLGFCIQALIRERETIFLVWVVSSVFFLFLSGITWPRYAMHGPWLWLSNILPATWGVEGFVKINTNGAVISQVGDCYTMLWILAGVYFLLATTAHKFAIRPETTRLRKAYGF